MFSFPCSKCGAQLTQELCWICGMLNPSRTWFDFDSDIKASRKETAMAEEKLFIKTILEMSLRLGSDADWQVQGLGMLRMYLNRETRIHVWHNGLVYHDTPSVIHNHPWEFVSRIIVGSLRNVRYKEDTDNPFSTPNHHVGKILCGPGGGLIPESSRDVRLEIAAVDEYKEGDVYYQAADELHNTIFQNGSVTLVNRKFKEDPDHASVAFPIGTQWKTAEPRTATQAEIELGIKAALERF